MVLKLLLLKVRKKLLAIDGINAVDLWLYTKNSYPSFRTEFTKIAPHVSSRDGMKYIFGRDINPHSNNEVMKEFFV